MSPNGLLLTLVAALALSFLLRRLVRTRSGGDRGWLIVVVLLGLSTVAGYLMIPEFAGYLAAAAWGLFVIVPMAGNRWLITLAGRERYRSAGRLAVFLRFVHPFDGWKWHPDLFKALEAEQVGDYNTATQILKELGSLSHVNIRLQAVLNLLRIERRWSDIRALVENEEANHKQALNPAVAISYLRALGELGLLDKMIETFSRCVASLDAPGFKSFGALGYLYVFAFCGRTDEVSVVLRRLLTVSKPTEQFWVATAMWASGDGTDARLRLVELSQTPHSNVSRAAMDRLSHPPGVATDLVSQRSGQVLDQLANRLMAAAPGRTKHFRLGTSAWATLTLAIANVVVFVVEVSLDATQDAEKLFRLGALALGNFDASSAHRLVTSLFLHAGYPHLLANLVGLLVIGRVLETRIGHFRFVTVYFLSGVAGAVASVLGAHPPDDPVILIGASGCVLGLAGGTASLLLWNRRRLHLNGSSMPFRAMVLAIALQVVADLVSPEVSITAHISGAVTGFVLVAGAGPPAGAGRGGS